MNTHGLVRFVKNGEVELYARLSSRRSELVAALIGGEYDLRPVGASAKQRRNLIRLGVRGQPEFIDFANEFVPFKVANGLVAANAKPVWFGRGPETRGSNR